MKKKPKVRLIKVEKKPENTVTMIIEVEIKQAEEIPEVAPEMLPVEIPLEKQENPWSRFLKLLFG